jgi:ubiquitin-conjugating enzyme E2 G1
MAQALRHITAKFRDYTKDPIDGFYVDPTDDLFKWKFTLLGMHDTPFEGELLNGLIIFTTAFPNEPPVIQFTTNMYHPNIGIDGKVCMSILHGSTTENFYDRPEERWLPVHTIQSIVLSMLIVLQDPNLESPANIDAAKSLRDNKKEYIKIVRNKLTVK